MGFGFHIRIYWTFIQLVTPVHKSQSDTPSSFSTGHSRLLTTLHNSTTSLRLLTVPSYNSSARTPQKTPPSVVRNACLLVRYLARDVLLLNAYDSGMCLPSRCLAMNICVTVHSVDRAIHLYVHIKKSVYQGVNGGLHVHLSAFNPCGRGSQDLGVATCSKRRWGFYQILKQLFEM
jgi:hypothetical protein